MVATGCPPGKRNLGMRTVTKEINGTSQSVQEPHCGDVDDQGNINFNDSSEYTHSVSKVSYESIKNDDPSIGKILKKYWWVILIVIFGIPALIFLGHKILKKK